jgi:hypothetical protein
LQDAEKEDKTLEKKKSKKRESRVMSSCEAISVI